MIPAVRELIAEERGGTLLLAVLEDEILCEFHAVRSRPGASGSVYSGRVAFVQPGMEAVFVDLGLQRPGYLSGEELPGEGPLRRRIRQGDEVLVQINREAHGEKGPRVTTRVSLSSACCVLCPGDGGVGVSKRVTDEEARRRLRALGEALCPPGCALILRTASAVLSETALRTEIEGLRTRWEEIEKRRCAMNAPALLEDASDPPRMLASLGGPDTPCAVTESAVRLLGDAARFPAREADGMMERRHIPETLRRAAARRVALPGGGELVFDSVEALTAIDVNASRDVGTRGKQASVTRTNLEAATVIANLIRLRNIGGITVVDFINMDRAEDRRAVHETLRAAMAADPAPHDLGGFTRLGLYEIARKRSGLPLSEALAEAGW